MTSPFPSFTPTWHSTPYPAISPSRPELSTKGRTVVVSGGGTGIGASIARAFAAAGSTKIAILGRREHVLLNTASMIEAEFIGSKVFAYMTDVSEVKSVKTVFDYVLEEFGHIDICISNAGYMPSTSPVAESGLEDWWRTYEVNVKGAFNITQAFLQRAKAGSILINISSGEAHMPTLIPGHSGYASSKSAVGKLFEYVARERPEIKVVNLQPGVIGTEMSRKGGGPSLDHVDLPSHFCVWLASDESSFLHGRFVYANWDVDEMIARKEEIARSQEMLTLGLVGVSFESWKL